MGQQAPYIPEVSSPTDTSNFDVDDNDLASPFIVEASFGNAAYQRHGTALEGRFARPTGAGSLTLVSATAGLSVTGPGTSADATPLLVFLYALMDFV